jgi:hypothetical protein
VGSSSGSEDRREDLRATAVPEPVYIEACFQAYPRERKGKGATARAVAIPEDGRVRIARFLLERPGYPLLDVFRAIAKTHDFPPAMADFLAEPWDAESTIRAAKGREPAEAPNPTLQAAAAEGEAWENMTAEEQAAERERYRQGLQAIRRNIA